MVYLNSVENKEQDCHITGSNTGASEVRLPFTSHTRTLGNGRHHMNTNYVREQWGPDSCTLWTDESANHPGLHMRTLLRLANSLFSRPKALAGVVCRARVRIRTRTTYRYEEVPERRRVAESWPARAGLESLEGRVWPGQD